MHIKKIVILVTSVAGLVNVANGTTYQKLSTVPPQAYHTTDIPSPYYVEGFLGFDNHNRGNLSIGSDLGYQFHRYFSGELGLIYTYSADWNVYFAGKMEVPIYKELYAFSKLGIGYERYESNDVVTPVLGVGIAYKLTPKIYFQGQWLRFVGDVPLAKEGASLFLAGIGYKFFC